MVYLLAYMDQNECSRCGRCCIEFEEQIHFTHQQTGDQTNIIFSERERSEVHLFVDLYRQIIGHWMRLNPKTKEFDYYIPSKRQIWNNHPNLANKYLPKETQNASECLFLAWNPKTMEDGTEINEPYCIIHGSHPIMCQDYPASKGYVCKNHPERKYTSDFLRYQQQKIGFAIEVLKQLFHEKIPSKYSFAFEILTILMDFGDFDIIRLKNFFQTSFKISDEDWQTVISLLVSHQLISVKNDKIQGISLKETEYLVDRIMKERGWDK